MSKDRIDVHQHVVPPFWTAELDAHGGDPSGWYSPDWSPDAAIAFMDSQEIRTGILSLTAPSVVGWQGAQRRDMATRVNEYTADLVTKHPRRFGNFATLPLPDMDGALREIDRAFRDFSVDGVILLSNYENHYLGEERYEVLWNELNRRNAVVFIHPGKPAIEVIPGMPGPIVDYPFDTTRTAVHIALNGVLNRHRNIKVILSHAGGFLPFASHRFAEAAAAVHPEGPGVDSLLETFRSFYFDTALSAGRAALPSLTAFAKPSNILFGSDFPYAPAKVGASFTAQLDAYTDMTEAAHGALNNGNARAMFLRLQSQLV